MNILIIKFDIQPTIYSYEIPRDTALPSPPIPPRFRLIKGGLEEGRGTAIYRGAKPKLKVVQHQIQINAKDLNKIKPKLLPYFSDHFLYKIHIGCKALG